MCSLKSTRDYDVATDALPSEVKAIFPRVIPQGENLGLLR